MWKSVFSFSKEQYARHRYFVANRTTVQNIVNRMGLDSPERQGMKTTIIEAYPGTYGLHALTLGPGTFTRAFMEHPNVERVIAMENVPSFLAQLEVCDNMSYFLASTKRSCLNVGERQASRHPTNRIFMGHL